MSQETETQKMKDDIHALNGRVTEWREKFLAQKVQYEFATSLLNRILQNTIPNLGNREILQAAVRHLSANGVLEKRRTIV